MARVWPAHGPIVKWLLQLMFSILYYYSNICTIWPILILIMEQNRQ